jgi:hypothetical protein
MRAAVLVITFTLVWSERLLAQSPHCESPSPAPSLEKDRGNTPSQQPLAHIRSEESWIRAAIERGFSRSRTFRCLVTALNASDVIVQIVYSNIVRDYVRAYTLNQVTVRGDFRYVRIAVARKATDTRLIGVIAHELQHAVEIAQAPDVGRTATVTDLFQRIDSGECLGGGCYETRAARKIQEIVVDELQGR